MNNQKLAIEVNASKLTTNEYTQITYKIYTITKEIIST